jgi:hypothetical protein
VGELTESCERLKGALAKVDMDLFLACTFTFHNVINYLIIKDFHVVYQTEGSDMDMAGMRKAQTRWRLDWDNATSTATLWECMCLDRLNGTIWRNHVTARSWKELVLT